MDEAVILADLDKIFTRVLKKEVHLSPVATTADVDGWDSLTHIIIIDSVEKHFAIKFKLKEIMKFSNVGDMVSCIKAKLTT